MRFESTRVFSIVSARITNVMGILILCVFVWISVIFRKAALIWAVRRNTNIELEDYDAKRIIFTATVVLTILGALAGEIALDLLSHIALIILIYGITFGIERVYIQKIKPELLEKSLRIFLYQEGIIIFYGLVLGLVFLIAQKL